MRRRTATRGRPARAPARAQAKTATARGGDALRGFAALLGILILTVGVPVALGRAIGWPLPHAVPSVAELRDALSRSGIPEEFFPKAVATFAWLVWAQFTACLVVELWSALRGRLARRVPGAGWGTQRLASNLVAAALLLLPSQGLSVVAFASTPQRPPAVVRTVAHAAGGTPGLLADQTTGTTTTTGGGNGIDAAGGQAGSAKEAARAPIRYEVERRDTLWDIAERHLGDPLRWPEIFELNKGRAQPDGRELKQAHWIFPGWTLLLPSDATNLPQPSTRPAQPASPAPSTHQQQPTATTQPHHNGTAPPSTAAPSTTTPSTTTPAPTTTVGGNGGDPFGLPGPGGQGSATTGTRPAAPSTTASSVTTTTQPSRGGGGVAPSDLTPTSRQAPPTTTSPEASQEPPGSATGEHWPVDNLSDNLKRAGLLAAGLLAVLGVFRVIQQRRRRFRRQIAMPDEELAPVEVALRAGEAPDAAELIDLAMRTLATAVRDQGMELPEVVGVLVGEEMLEVLLATETPAAPEPFVLSYSRRRWGLPVEIPLERLREAAGDAASPVPALVTLGHTDGGLLLVNLESPGLTALGGDEDAARAVLSSFAVELATCRWADYIELILVGFGDELERLERARAAGTVREMLPWLEHKADDVADLLSETRARSVLAGRVAGTTPDGWVPAVVLCAERPTPEEVTRLVALTAVPSRSPVAAVIAAGDVPGARWTLELPDHPGEPIHLPQFGLDVIPQRLDPDDYRGVAGLLETTTRGDVPIPEPARRPFRRPAPAPAAAFEDDEVEDDELAEPDEFGEDETETDEGSDVTSAEPAAPDEPAEPTAPAASGTPSGTNGTPSGTPASGTPVAGTAEPETRKTPHLHELRLNSRTVADASEVEEEPEVEVRVLGKVEIGGIERVERGKSEELIVFLALHPDGVDGDQLSEALWPGRPPAKGTLNTTTAVARAYLGMTPDNEPRLPHARNGIYRLDPSVGLDWSRFQTLAERGYAVGSDGADDLRRALELVRGRPFQGAKPRSYGWAQLDEVPVMESSIVDAADHLAGLLLQAGDHAGCQWAARRGLSTAPYDERLYRKLMLAADAAGNPSGVEAIMDELLLRLDEENLEPYDTLHEETRALYERLTRHRATRKTNAG